MDGTGVESVKKCPYLLTNAGKASKIKKLSWRRAGVAQWQSTGFPSRLYGFDSRHPLHITQT